MHGRRDKSGSKRRGRVERCTVEIKVEKERNKGDRRGVVNKRKNREREGEQSWKTEKGRRDRSQQRERGGVGKRG